MYNFYLSQRYYLIRRIEGIRIPQSDLFLLVGFFPARQWSGWDKRCRDGR
jgi:hypothetical protein